MNHSKLILALSGLILIIVTGLTVLIASGILQFGFQGPVVFVLYIISGVFVALSCFGILTSTGELAGEPYGINIRLGGAIVGLVVVVAGGGIYEVFVRDSESTKLQIVLYTENRNNIPEIEAELTLILDATTVSKAVNGRGIVVFENLPPSWLGRDAAFIFDSREYGIAVEDGLDVKISEGTSYVEIKKKAAFSTYEESDLRISPQNAFSEPMVSGEQTLTVWASAVSLSERPVPIRTYGEISFNNEAGLEFRTISSNVNISGVSEFILLKPNEPRDIAFDALLPEDWEFLLARAPEVILSVFYHDFEDTVRRKVFYSESFDFDENFVEFSR
ncbi:hypothetical protein [Sedimentitalea todarodis]|uniref:Uncharacterized protein n=1 Tax=Sedimentitalea todarodis TaxID=1631240 RepID=A0ABU3VLH2_9RHOB|nr:hypothetical protein [Sedimentitalea todarodis]MDU9006958.1 hypothetical protein [Sedimentitalea todarodis]